MKLLRLLALSGAALALDDKCLEKEFLADGYSTGQNIEMNYDASEIKLMDVEVDGETESQTFLHLEFLVPKRYTEQHEDNSFALTFNRRIGVGQSLTIPDTYIDDDGNEQTYTDSEDHLKQMNMYVGEFNDDQSACFSNKAADGEGNAYEYCEAMEEDLWTIEDNGENDCISDVSADIPWENVMDTAFGGVGADEGVEIQYNGNFIEIFLTATVETWTLFSEGDVENYLGVMTGAESRTNLDDTEGDNNRKGEYRNDAGWLGWPNDPDAGEFGNIVIDDERYTLYQIPFILRFPRTVMVQTEFRAAQDLTLLTGVVAQDVIQINLNPEDDGVFAYVEAVLTTQIQYPYGIRSPHNDKNGMTVVIGGLAGDGDHAAAVEFIEFDPESVCNGQGDFAPEGTCEQSFKFRITPDAANPCSVAGEYTFEMWATCIGARGADKGQKGVQGCAIDDLVDSDDITDRRNSNSYFTRTINIDHQDFCPELMDEVRVVGDFRVYKDEAFETRVDNDRDDVDAWKYTVFTNDQLFFEATYRTASAKSGETITDNGDVDDLDQDNDVDEYGKDSIIDYVRPTKIYMDVTLGQDRDGAATTAYGGWDADNWGNNMNFAPLGGPRIPDQQITGESDEFTLETGAGEDGKGVVAKYQIVLCEVEGLPASQIIDSVNKPDYCFANTKDIAREYLDFTRVQSSKDGVDGFQNSIDENEVAFNLRMDERILPVKPSSDESYATFTIEAEVYYKGNRHPTTKGFENGGNRRRLQQADAPQPPASRRQAHIMSVGFDIFNNKRIRTCAVDNNDEFGAVQLKFAYNSAREMPTAADMASFTSDITKQIGDYHQVENAVSVEQVERCESKDCRLLYARKSHAGYRRRMEEEGSAAQGSMRRMEEEVGSAQGSSRRRMEEEVGSAQGSSRRLQADEEDGFFLYVTLGFKTTSNPAGRVINVFQNNVVDSRNAMHRKIPIFAAAKVTEMTVDKCNGDLGVMRMAKVEGHEEGLVRDKRGVDALMDAMREEARTQESAAPRAAAWLAGLLATLAYLAW